MKLKMFETMNPPVFLGAAALVILFVAFGALFTPTAAAVFEATQTWIVHIFGWYYVLIATFFLIFTLAILFSPFAKIKLGPQDAKPEFSTLAWFVMLFSAGMGTGLVFWGVAEPVTHYLTPPEAVPKSDEAVREALRYTFFHWGLHPWAIYIVLGLGIAYFHFRRGLPLAPRSVLYPLIGERFRGWIGHCVDILCTVGTLLGVATSLGLGAMQVNTGLTEISSVPNSVTVQVIIIAVITLIATASVVVGIHGGIRRLSQANLVLAALLFTFVLLAGPTLHILETLVTTTGGYLQKLIYMSFRLDITGDDQWQTNWTLFYWGWWISWSPFVGVFVARISYGRTVREFIISVLLVPVLVTFCWLAVFGGTGLFLTMNTDLGLAEIVQNEPALSLHVMLRGLPLTEITSIIATLLVVIFFITSSDSGSLVDDMVTSGGHPNPPVSQRVFWAVSEGAVAATLLLAGGLVAMQNAAISTGFPMSLLLVAACAGLWKGMREDVRSGAEATAPPDDTGPLTMAVNVHNASLRGRFRPSRQRARYHPRT